MDKPTGVTHSRVEATDFLGIAHGYYEVREPDCIIRRVQYNAEASSGFRVLNMNKRSCDELPANANKQRKVELKDQKQMPRKLFSHELFESGQNLDGISVSTPSSGGFGLSMDQVFRRDKSKKLHGVFMEQQPAAADKQEQQSLSLPEQVKLEAGIIFNHAPARTAPSVPPRGIPDDPEISAESSTDSPPTKRKAEGKRSSLHLVSYLRGLKNASTQFIPNLKISTITLIVRIFTLRYYLKLIFLNGGNSMSWNIFVICKFNNIMLNSNKNT